MVPPQGTPTPPPPLIGMLAGDWSAIVLYTVQMCIHSEYFTVSPLHLAAFKVRGHEIF